MLERPVWAEVDLSAIVRNCRALRSLLKAGVRHCAVVKADAYGHGLLPVSRELVRAGADMLAVAIAAEGIELRRSGFACPVLVMGWTAPEQALAAVGSGLELAVFSEEDARGYSDAARALGRKARLHLKIDSGMNRLGVRPADAAALASAIAAMPGIELAGAFSHFADADSPDLGFARGQLDAFLAATAAVEGAGIPLPLRHMANSAATIVLPEAHLDMVRTGISLYGYMPSAGMEAAIALEPAMTLKARVAMVKEIRAGETVSYGRTFEAARASLIATLPLGYADGWPRALSGRGSVALAGGRAPVAGRICMDQFMVDATGLGAVRAGDEAVLFGPGGPGAEELAASLGTISYEVLCMVGKRVPRVYSGGAL